MSTGLGQETVAITYQGTAPGADANTYVIFNSAVAFPSANYMAMNRLKRLQVSLSNSGTGTYNWYKSNTRLTNPSATVVWTQIGTLAVAAGATASNDNDFLIENLADFKLEWVNGGAAQTTWVVNLALSGERVKST